MRPPQRRDDFSEYAKVSPRRRVVAIQRGPRETERRDGGGFGAELAGGKRGPGPAARDGGFALRGGPAAFRADEEDDGTGSERRRKPVSLGVEKEPLRAGVFLE